MVNMLPSRQFSKIEPTQITHTTPFLHRIVSWLSTTPFPKCQEPSSFTSQLNQVFITSQSFIHLYYLHLHHLRTFSPPFTYLAVASASLHIVPQEQ